MTAAMRTLVPAEMPPREAYRLMLSLIVPRPIAWVSTVSPDGTANLAPYSFFNGVSGDPPLVMISVSPRSARFGGGVKDTLRNAEATGELVINLVAENLAEAMNQTSGEWDYAVDEFTVAGLEKVPSIDVKPPRVAAALAAMEARTHQIVRLEGTASTLIIARLLRYHVRADLLRDDGTVDAARLHPVARLGGREYAHLGTVFTLDRPSTK